MCIRDSTLGLNSTSDQTLVFETSSQENGNCTKVEHERELFTGFLDDFDPNSNVESWIIQNQVSLGRPYQCAEYSSDTITSQFSVQFEAKQVALINGSNGTWYVDDRNNIVFGDSGAFTVWSSITAENFSSSQVFTALQSANIIRCN